jgi:DNA-binding SARP family transcriptional activator
MRQALLGLLLARANEPVGVDALVEALWGGEPDERHVPRLHMHVSKLRKALGVPDRLTFDGGTYSLKVLPDELDAHRFDSLLDEATSISRSDPQRCVEVLRKALGLWRGDAYQGLDFADLQGPAQQLSEERMVAYETLMTAELACGRHAQIVAELQELVRAHPFRERLHALLVTALYRGGRQADALAAYRAARQTLVDELGLEPGPELRAIEHQILAGEPVELDGSSRDIATRREVVPAQLPPEGRFFVGRAAELATLDRLADDGGSVMVVSALAGTAGVGKTALAMRWAHRVRDRFDDGQLYVDLRGYGPDDPVAPEDVLAGFLRALGMDGAAIPHEIAERTARFRSMVDGRRMLIVLDNARSVDQVRPLLPGTPTCFVLVTSRDSLAGLVTRDGAHRIDLDQLSDHEAHRLVREILGDHVDVDPGAVAQLVESCARLPLALRIATERIREIGSVVEVVTELADEQARLDLLDAGGDPQTAVRAVFSWSYRQLPPDCARLFRLCGLHPGQDVDLYALTALAGNDDVRVTRRQVEPLVRAHLVSSKRAGRYQAHDLLRAYAAELAADRDREDDGRAALARLFDYYVHAAAAAMDVVHPYERDRRPVLPEPYPSIKFPDFSSPERAMAWLDGELPNLLAAAQHCADVGGHAHVVRLSGVLRRHLDMNGRLTEAETLHRHALTAAETTNERGDELTALLGVADTNRHLGRYEVALTHFRQAARIAHQVRDHVGESQATWGLGVVLWNLGRHEDAFDHFHQALMIAQQEGDPVGEQEAHRGLGHVHRLQGRHEIALVHFELALAAAEVTGDRTGTMRTLLGLGDAERTLGLYESAFEHYEQALALARAVVDRLCESEALLSLGHVHRRLGQYNQAFENYQEAWKIAVCTGDRVTTIRTLNSLGHVHRLQGRSREAEDCYLRVRAQAEQIGNRNWQYEALQGLGRLFQRMGDASAALSHHQQALDLAISLDQPDDQARAHDGLAHAHHALAQYEQARCRWRAALDLLANLGIEQTEDEEATVPAIRAHLADLEMHASTGDPNPDR